MRINDVTFHEFGLNGYPHKLAHGDWFGGKGLGVGQIDYKEPVIQSRNKCVFYVFVDRRLFLNPCSCDLNWLLKEVPSFEKLSIKISCAKANLPCVGGLLTD